MKLSVQNRSPIEHRVLSRRTVLSGLALGMALPLVARVSRAQDAAAAVVTSGVKQLPLRTTGLEHMGSVVPDVTSAAKFYSRVFSPDIYKEKDPPLRYYVTLNPGYLAFGSRANATTAFFDHFCALVTDYDATSLTEELKAQGMTGGRFGIIPDPDAIGLQLLKDPAGLAKTTEPAPPLLEGEALLRPKGLDAVVLHVADVEKSAQFYRKFFGPERAASRKGETWFQVAGTELGLAPAAAGESPHVDHIRVKVEPFNAKVITKELQALGGRVTKGSSSHSLRLTDPMGLSIELKPV